MNYDRDVFRMTIAIVILTGFILITVIIVLFYVYLIRKSYLPESAPPRDRLVSSMFDNFL